MPLLQPKFRPTQLDSEMCIDWEAQPMGPSSLKWLTWIFFLMVCFLFSFIFPFLDDDCKCVENRMHYPLLAFFFWMISLVVFNKIQYKKCLVPPCQTPHHRSYTKIYGLLRNKAHGPNPKHHSCWEIPTTGTAVFWIVLFLPSHMAQRNTSTIVIYM